MVDSRQQDMSYQPEAHGYTDAPPEYSSRGHGTSPETTLTGNQEAELMEETEAQVLEETLCWIPRQFAMQQMPAPPLRKPVLIPRMDTVFILKIPLPFMRAYSRDLRSHNVNERDFVGFIDNLCVAQAPPAPLQAINLTGNIVRFVPTHTTQLAGFGMTVVAGLGTAAVRVTRTKRFMQAVNQHYFAPRKLKASLVKNRDLPEKLGLDPRMPLLAPIDANHAGFSNTLPGRRLKALEPYIAPLTFDVPPPTEQRNIIDRFAAKQIEDTIAKKNNDLRKKEAKLQMKQERQDRLRRQGVNIPPSELEGFYSSDSDDSDSSLASLDELFEKLQREMNKVNLKASDELRKANDGAKASKIIEKRDKETRKIEEKRMKLDEKAEEKREKQRRKGEKRRSKAMKRKEDKLSKEIKMIEKMEYILIQNGYI